MLQVDARNVTAQEMADKTGVSASTVRNRIDRLEAEGVIEGYSLEIDYDAAKLPLQVLFVITAPPTERGDYVEKLLEIKGVVDVHETITAQQNLYVEVVGSDTSDITRMTEAVHDLGLEIERSDIVKQRRLQPFNHFHYHDGPDDADIDP